MASRMQIGQEANRQKEHIKRDFQYWIYDSFLEEEYPWVCNPPCETYQVSPLHTCLETQKFHLLTTIFPIQGNNEGGPYPSS